MFPIRRNFLNDGCGLDRRRLEENFLQAAQHINDVKDYSISQHSIRRRNFTSDAWIQVNWNKDEDRNNIHYIGVNRHISGVVVDVSFPDYVEVVVDWSCNVQTLNNHAPFGTTTDAKLIVLCPTVNGVLYRGGQDVMELNWPFNCQAGDDQHRLDFDLQHQPPPAEPNTAAMQHTMSGSFATVVPSGTSRIALLYNGTAGEGKYDPRDNTKMNDWVVSEATIVCRSILR